MRPYKQLDLEERRKIETWRAAKVGVDVIAERLGRDRSTIFRELRRNHFTDAEMPKVVGYFGVVASMKALSRRQKDRKLMRHTALRELIIERIKDGWTPEQIARRSATFDRGSEFMDWPHLQAEVRIQTWLCDHSSP